MLSIKESKGKFFIDTGEVRLEQAVFHVVLEDQTLKSGDAEFSLLEEVAYSIEELGPGRLVSYSCTWPGKNISAVYRIGVFERALSIDLSISNDSGSPIFIKRLSPLVLPGEGLGLGKCLRDIVVFKNGIRKNDLVSVYRFGGGGGFDIVDVTARGNEDASFTEIELPEDTLPVNSSYLTVLRSASEGKSVLAGFYTLKRQFSHSQLVCDKEENRLLSWELYCDLDGIKLDAGGRVESEKLLLDFGETFSAIDRYSSLAARIGQGRGDRPPLKGWCSWYFFYESVTEKDVIRNLEFIKSKGLEADTILIDMGWEERLGTWRAGTKFPQGMKRLAEQIHAAGFKAGLWLSPFWVEPRSEFHRDHPEWLLRDRDGNLIVFHCHIDGYVIDTTIPDACRWIEDTFRRVSSEWGFDLVKLDFLRAVSLFPEAKYKGNYTRAEALALGMDALRRGCGEKTIIIACGGQYGPTLGIADINRTSNDIGANWNSFKMTFKKNILRYWMNGKWWTNDPDCLIIRNETEGKPGRIAGYETHSAQGTFTACETETILALFETLGGQIFLGDDLPQLSPVKIQRLKTLLNKPVSQTVASCLVPRDMFKNPYPHILDRQSSDGNHFVTIVNWNNEPLTESPLIDDLIGEIPKGLCYQIYDSTGRLTCSCRANEQVDEYTIEPHGVLVLSINMTN